LSHSQLIILIAVTSYPQTTASTDHFLGAFGLTDNLEEQVQSLDAEPANGEVVRRQITSNTHRQPLYRQHQRIVMPRRYKG
jgi:hypothetical protein